MSEHDDTQARFSSVSPSPEMISKLGPQNSSPSWVEKIKSEGTIPLLEPDNCSNGWATPNGDIFMVRGPDYLTSKLKIPAGDYLLKPLGFDWLKSTSKISEVLNNPDSRVRKIIDANFEDTSKAFIWAFNLQLPSNDNYSAIMYFYSPEPPPEGSLLEMFVKGDDTLRNSRLKLIANIVEGPWIVKAAVGDQAICLIAKVMSCKYTIGDNFFEIDIDVGSHMVANAIVHLAFGYITTLTVDLAFLIEGQSEDELPERLLGALRFSQLTFESAGLYEEFFEGREGNSESSLSSRLWRSIGGGFSHFLHPGSQDLKEFDIDGKESGSQENESSDEDNFEDAES